MVAFADASKLAYCCVIYALSYDDEGRVAVRFVTAKARVAPLHSVSVPKLAQLACWVAETVCSVLDYPLASVAFYTDAMDVLWWVRGRGRNFRPFVEHRRNTIGEIQRLTDPNCWQYVPSAENPADLATRGLSGEVLENSELWWSGPHWLVQPMDQWPRMPTDIPKTLKERRVTPMILTGTIKESERDFVPLPERYENLSKLCRIAGWMIRFCGSYLS